MSYVVSSFLPGTNYNKLLRIQSVLHNPCLNSQDTMCLLTILDSLSFRMHAEKSFQLPLIQLLLRYFSLASYRRLYYLDKCTLFLLLYSLDLSKIDYKSHKMDASGFTFSFNHFHWQEQLQKSLFYYFKK